MSPMESPSEDTDVPSQPDASEGDVSRAPSDEEGEDEGGDEGNDGDNDDDDGGEDDDGDRTVTGARTVDEAAVGAATGINVGTTTTRTVKACPNLDKLFGLREIGKEALCWQLSSAKPGNGVEQIRDESIDTYWQSDGNSQPHWIQVHLSRRVAISHVCLYLDYNLDESYTPKKLQVEVGMTNQDLISALHPANTQIELHEPVGWCIIPLSSPPDPLDDHYTDASVRNHSNEDETNSGVSPTPYVRAHLLRISILSMHQNGRDTHVRQVQLYGPRTQSNPLTMSCRGENIDPTYLSQDDNITSPDSHQPATYGDDDFSSMSLNHFSTIR